MRKCANMWPPGYASPPEHRVGMKTPPWQGHTTAARNSAWLRWGAQGFQSQPRHGGRHLRWWQKVKSSRCGVFGTGVGVWNMSPHSGCGVCCGNAQTCVRSTRGSPLSRYEEGSTLPRATPGSACWCPPHLPVLPGVRSLVAHPQLQSRRKQPVPVVAARGPHDQLAEHLLAQPSGGRCPCELKVSVVLGQRRVVGGNDGV